MDTNTIIQAAQNAVDRCGILRVTVEDVTDGTGITLDDITRNFESFENLVEIAVAAQAVAAVETTTSLNGPVAPEDARAVAAVLAMHRTMCQRARLILDQEWFNVSVYVCADDEMVGEHWA